MEYPPGLLKHYMSVLGVNSLTFWDKFEVHDAANMEENQQHALGCALCPWPDMPCSVLEAADFIEDCIIDTVLITSNGSQHELWVILTCWWGKTWWMLPAQVPVSWRTCKCTRRSGPKICATQMLMLMKWCNLDDLIACTCYVYITSQRSIRLKQDKSRNFLIAPHTDEWKLP